MQQRDLILKDISKIFILLEFILEKKTSKIEELKEDLINYGINEKIINIDDVEVDDLDLEYFQNISIGELEIVVQYLSRLIEQSKDEYYNKARKSKLKIIYDLYIRKSNSYNFTINSQVNKILCI